MFDDAMRRGARTGLVRAAFAASLAVTSLGCGPPLDVGEFGDFRYAGNARVQDDGTIPMLPPMSDRDGNAYVLYGDVNLLERKLYIGNVAGGWFSGCIDLTQGNDFGVHGFVGRAQSTVWYWNGYALIRAAPTPPYCSRVLEFDPKSDALLNFLAVVPWVRETPSRTTTLAYVQAPSDPLPFRVVVDLQRNIYTNVAEFEPSNAEEVTVLGTGGILQKGEGVFIVRYRVGETVRTAARFIDYQGQRLDSIGLSGLENLPPYGIIGYVQGNSEGLYAFLDVEGQVTTFDKSGSRRRAVGSMNPVGIQEWGGDLYLVGTSSGGRPRIAPILDNGSFGDTRTWGAAEAAADNLDSKIVVTDDRSLPSRDTTWKNPRTAIGTNFFVSPHKLDHYAQDTTTWLVTGPSFGAQSGNEQIAIAWVPVGISYAD